MKKKMTVLGGLLLAALVSAYSVCGTYAKYVSSFDAVDEARVAKWDFSLVGNSSNSRYDIDLFKDSYEITSGVNPYTYVVSSEAGVKVVAPGTQGEYTYNVVGTAETNYTVDMTVDIENNIKIVDDVSNKEIYNPILFSIDGGKTWMTDTNLKNKLETLFNKGTVYPANFALDTKSTIQWKWAFETTKDITTGKDIVVDAEGNVLKNFKSNDTYDTELARKQGDIKVSVNLTVTQSNQPATAKIPAGNGSATIVPVLTKNVSATSMRTFVGKGYDASNTSNVRFNGKSLTGSIDLVTDATKKAKLDAYFGAANATGYYYPISIEVPKDKNGIKVYYGKNVPKDILVKDGKLDILFALNPTAKAEDKIIPIKVVIDTLDDGSEVTQDIVVDYSNLVFNN